MKKSNISRHSFYYSNALYEFLSIHAESLKLIRLEKVLNSLKNANQSKFVTAKSSAEVSLKEKPHVKPVLSAYFSWWHKHMHSTYGVLIIISWSYSDCYGSDGDNSMEIKPVQISGSMLRVRTVFSLFEDFIFSCKLRSWSLQDWRPMWSEVDFSR